MGAEIFVNTNVTEVITENGKIVGVKASSSNNEMSMNDFSCKDGD